MDGLNLERWRVIAKIMRTSLFLGIIGSIILRPLFLRIEELGGGSPWGGIWPFYPLLLLPFFREAVSPGIRTGNLIEGSLALTPLFFGAATGIQGLIFLGGAWLGMALAPSLGHTFRVQGRMILLLLPPFSTAPELLFGFPLRLALTRAAAGILVFLDAGVGVKGNTVLFRGNEFAVDPACEGLKMFVALVVLLLLLTDRRTGKVRSPLRALIILAPPALILWLGSNFVRIVLLIIANVPTASPLHGVLGILIFFSLVVMPLTALRELLFANTDGHPRKEREAPDYGHPESHRSSMIVALALAVIAVVAHIIPYGQPARYPAWPDRLAGFEVSERAGREDREIIAYRRNQIALILKTNDAVYRLGHNPRRCWQGLGYRFLSEEEITLPDGGRIRRARLIPPTGKSTRGSAGYQLIWWYQDITNNAGSEGGSKRFRPPIASEFVWRRETLFHRRQFVQINLFAPEEREIIPLADRISRIAGKLTGTKSKQY